jgi:hypothetical protein
MKKLFGVVAVLALLCIGGVAQAATWELFYDAAPSNTGPTGNTVLRLSSPTTGTDPYGYIRYKPDTPFALNNLTNLSTDFNMVQGPFTGGSPRFDIGLDFNNDGAFDWTNDRLIYAYWGTQPWGGGTPPTGWTNTGNFMGTSLWGDITFFDGNTQYTLAGLNTAFGNLNVMRVYVSLDSGWAGNSQILDIDNFTVNNDVYSAASVPEPASMLLLGFGLIGLAGFATRRKK